MSAGCLFEPCVQQHSTHFIHSSYETSEPVALQVTLPPTGLPSPVAPWGSSSPPSSPSAMFILVKSPKPWTCQYRGVRTKWTAERVPSGMTRASLRGWTHQATWMASVSPMVLPVSGGAKTQLGEGNVSARRVCAQGQATCGPWG